MMEHGLQDRSGVDARTVRFQGGYYAATGIWSVLHRRSFESVSGRKADYWLVRTVGALSISIGGALLAGSRKQSVSTEARVLSAATALSFAAVDVYYATRGRI